jgi:broad specificity phosphatase PhoE
MKNQYYLVRHGYSLRNEKNIASCWPERKLSPLTERGEKEAVRAAKKLKKEKIDLIFYSDLLRTKQTAEIIGKEIGLKPQPDERLREIDVGSLNGLPIDEVSRFWDLAGILNSFDYYEKRYRIAPPQGENYIEAENRVSNLLQDMEEKYQGKKILLVSHGRVITLLEKIVYGYGFEELVEIITGKKEIKTGEIRKLPINKIWQ